MRKGVAAAKEALDNGDGTALYKALQQDVVAMAGIFTDPKDYIAWVHTLAKLQQSVEKTPGSTDNIDFDEATAFMEATQAKMAAMEKNTYQEYVEEGDDEE